MVVPALNEEEFLPDCLDSLKNQDYSEAFEIIVADNGSTDKTAAIARSFEAKVVSCSEVRSVFYARQKGADAAQGDIIVQADADTVYPEEWLRKVAEQFAAHPETVAITGRFFYRDPPWWAKVEYFLRYFVNLLAATFLGRPLIISGATFAFRRDAFLSANGYRGLSYAADQYGIAERLAKIGKVRFVKDWFVLTSSRRVKKPLARILYESQVNILKWESHLLQSVFVSAHQFMGKPAVRHIAFGLVPVTIILLFLAHGYFVPASPFFGEVYYEGDSSEKVIALTFDDGPNEPYTSEILGILKTYDIKATFFVVGKTVEQYPDTTRRILAEGHVVGNHSYSNKTNLAITENGYKDLKWAEEVIFDVVGVRPLLYRPPEGRKTPWELQEIKADGITAVTWSVSTNENQRKLRFWEQSPEMLAERIVNEAKPGKIVLLHDGYDSNRGEEANRSLTVRALPLIIKQLRADGYRFVTVPELLNVPAYGAVER
ncbi:MAG: glycosyltransferase [Chloroflexi bacterium]|nr:glycosyltransferase [Chloroflexota bacterium]